MRCETKESSGTSHAIRKYVPCISDEKTSGNRLTGEIALQEAVCRQNLLGLFLPQEKERTCGKKELSTPETSSANMDTAFHAETVLVESSCEEEASSSLSESNEPPSTDQMKRIEDLEAQLLQVQQELTSLRLENQFSLDRFKSDADTIFYTSLPNYSTFTVVYEYLNPGENCENIRPRSGSDVPEDFYNSGQFAPRTRPTDNSPHGQFAPRTIRPQPQDNSPHGQFTPYIYCTNLTSLNSLNIAN